jgi:lipoate-protein ligase A
VNATRWNDYKWQLVHAMPQAPALHMALDEVLTDEVAARRRPPTLRVWEWSASCVVIGRFQSLRNEVDPEGAQRHGIEVVRRISGGGAMFIEPGNTITYSLYAPESLVAGMSFQESYEFMDAWVIDALQGLGIHAWYQPLNDIASPAGKIAGAAQTRRGGAVLHHVTMAYDIDSAKMLDVLRIGREKLSDKATQSAAKRVDPLRSQTGLMRAQIIDKMVATFRARHGLVHGGLSPEELEQAGALAASKFTSAAWTGIVP